MKRQGFTLVELLVVIAIIALLMGILMPALARVRQLAFRLTCGTNLSGIGKAMLVYANDFEDELPKAGARTNTWAYAISEWDATTMDRGRCCASSACIDTLFSRIGVADSDFSTIRFRRKDAWWRSNGREGGGGALLRGFGDGVEKTLLLSESS